MANTLDNYYEYGWGDSFHFGTRQKWEPHSKCIANSQNFVAQKLRVNDMDRVLDMGCGIGGAPGGFIRQSSVAYSAQSSPKAQNFERVASASGSC